MIIDTMPVFMLMGIPKLQIKAKCYMIMLQLEIFLKVVGVIFLYTNIGILIKSCAWSASESTHFKTFCQNKICYTLQL